MRAMISCLISCALFMGVRAIEVRGECTREDAAHNRSTSEVEWVLSGCERINLSCPGGTREVACNRSLSKGEIEGLALAIGETGAGLTAIELRGNWLGPHGAAVLANALANHPSLVSLSLASCRIGDYGVISLVKGLLASPPPRLERIDLSHNSVGDVGARELGTLLENDGLPSLNELDLSWNGIGPRGGRYLGTALSTNRGLKNLNLDWNGLMDRGARAIGEALSENSGLARLSLEFNAIKNEGARALIKGLRTNGALSQILLEHNGVSRAVLDEVVVAVQSMPELATTAPNERRADDGAEGEIEEISFDDEPEEEAPQVLSARECVDHGPWPCEEQNCPANSIDCGTLVQLGLCDTRFDGIWEAKPPDGIGSMQVWQRCAKSCKRCGNRDEL